MKARIAAWASKQSEVLQSRKRLIDSIKEYKKKYNDEKNVTKTKLLVRLEFIAQRNRILA